MLVLNAIPLLVVLFGVEVLEGSVHPANNSAPIKIAKIRFLFMLIVLWKTFRISFLSLWMVILV